MGEASDDQAVAGVTVAVQRSSDGWWLQSDGSWAEQRRRLAPPSALPGRPWRLVVRFLRGERGRQLHRDRARNGHGWQADRGEPWLLRSGESRHRSARDHPRQPDGWEELPAGTVRLSGSASDDRSVAEVRVGIKDRQANLWLQPDGTWSSSWAYLPAPLSAPGAPATDFLLDVELAPGSYWAFARGVDEAGNVDPTASGAKLLRHLRQPRHRSARDHPRQPDGWEELPAGTVRLSGSASDDRSVAEVRVGIKDRQANLWLQPDGTWSSSWAYLPAPLSAPGAPATDFLLDVELAPGSYWAFARGVDEAGNVDPTASGASFSVTSTDDVAPDGTITAPEAGQTLSQPVALTGRGDRRRRGHRGHHRRSGLRDRAVAGGRWPVVCVLPADPHRTQRRGRDVHHLELPGVGAGAGELRDDGVRGRRSGQRRPDAALDHVLRRVGFSVPTNPSREWDPQHGAVPLPVS